MKTVMVVVTAASPARHLADLVARLESRGWSAVVQATEAARAAFAQDWPEGLRTETAARDQAMPDAVLVAPASFHTAAALAAGLNHTESLQMINRCLGAVPVHVWPHVDRKLAANPLLRRNLRQLAEAGVHVIEMAVCDGGCPADAHWSNVLDTFDAASRTELG